MIAVASLIVTIATPIPLLAATDGTSGPSSTGTFQADVTVLPPAESSVHVVGLDDIMLSTTTASNAVQYVGGTTSACLNMSNPGSILVTIAQIDTPLGAGVFRLTDGNNQEAPITFTVGTSLGTSSSSTAGIWETPADSASNCNPAYINAGHAITGTVEVQPGTASIGNLSGQFSLTIAPKS